MHRTQALVVSGVLALSGCGGDGGGGSDPYAPPSEDASEQRAGEPANEADDAARNAGGARPAAGRATSIRLARSEFGSMLFDSRGQAIYVFENDPRGKSVCYGECAQAWPPVHTQGEPTAAQGVRRSLLGTLRRRDGRLQVTYAGRPLYFYAHEEPGQVLCHDVNLNGGLWWVVGPDGRPRA